MDTASLNLSTRGKMLNLILSSADGITKKEIFEEMGVSMPTVHKYMDELQEMGLICAGKAKPSTGGRRATGYVVNPMSRFSVGVAVTAGYHRFLALDLSGAELAYKSIHNIFGTIEELAENIDNELREFISENGLEMENLLGVCIAIPAIMNRKKEEFQLSPTMNLKNDSYAPLMKLPYPVYIENDAVCAASAQLPADDFVYLFLEQGVGGAICHNGRLFHGDNHKSAEFGHMCIVPGGKTCYCGKKGCLETYVSSRRYKQELALDNDEFFMFLKRGDEACRTLWDDILSYLAVGIHNLRVIFDCDIILGGFVAAQLPEYMDQLRARVSALDPFDDDADFLYLAKKADRANMEGAAHHFIREFIEKV